MKLKEKRMILILILITIVVIIISIVIKNNNKDKEEQNNASELVQQKEDGSKQSISDKLKETKTIKGMEITNIQITEKNGEATITANVTNKTQSEKSEFPITIKVLNKQGEVIQNVGAYVGKTKPEETRIINASISMDISEIYDIKFE